MNGLAIYKDRDVNGLAIYKDRGLNEVTKNKLCAFFSALRVNAELMAPSSGDMALC
jgi:hypothetical protein